MGTKKWKLGKGLKKGLFAAVSVAVGIIGAVEIAGGAAGLGELGIATGIGAIVGGIRVGINWWKINYKEK